MPKVRAVLLDVFETVVTVDFDAAFNGLVAADALFVDDQPAYCAGAESVGLTAVQIDRRATATGVAHSLDDILPLLR